jgi:phage terminase large subunit GpA-like protein
MVAMDTLKPQFADARVIVAEAWRAFLPPERMNVAECAAQRRWLNNPGAYVGRWQHTRTPYLVGPMEALTSPDHIATAVVGPARSGKTEIGCNWLLHSVLIDPGNLLWYLPSDPSLRAFVKQEINPMIELHDAMRERLGTKRVDNSLEFKRFRGMTAQFLTVAYNNLISKTASRIVLDEIDAYPESLGDVYALADLRRQTAGWDSMVLAISHPDRARGLGDRYWNSGIMRLYGQSDRRTWWWPCPHCGAWSSPNPTAARVMTLDYPIEASLEEIEQAACLRCPTCGAEIADGARQSMNAAGRWIGLGQNIDEDGNVTGELQPRAIAGFWIVGVMSPFVIGGLGTLARAYEAARREFEATNAAEHEKSLRDVVVKRLGVPYDPPRRVGALEANTIADRAEADLQLGRVPEGVRFLTAYADVQANRFEVLVRGWGIEAESWVIEHQRRAADPATSPAAWDDLLREVLEGAWPLADGSGRVMRVRAVGIDSGGAPGATAQSYAAWRRWFMRRRIRALGRVDGRESWSVMLTKGFGSPNAPLLSVTRPDSERKDRAARASGAVPVAMFNANAFKDDLAGQLACAEQGPRFVHFPAALRSPAPPHPFFEQLVAETRKPNGVWIKGTARNEALDLMVGSHVIAHLNGLARINWERPPAWAADWDRNALVGAPAEAPAESRPVAAAAPALAPSGPGPLITQPKAAERSNERLKQLVSKLA